MIQPGHNLDNDKPIGDALRYVFVSLPKCPECNVSDYRTYRTTKSDDGSKTQYAQCRCCEHKFQIVWE